MDYIGSRISLVSKSDIRYVGLLHEINGEESTIALQQVRSFGTEGRRGDQANEIPPSDNIFEYIVFRGSDVKDLRIEEQNAPKPPQPQPQVPDDPAILGSSAGRQGGPPASAGYGNPNMPTQFGGPQPGYMPHYHQQPGPPMQGYGPQGTQPEGHLNDSFSMPAGPPKPKEQEALQRTKPVHQPQLPQQAKPTQQLPLAADPSSKLASAGIQPHLRQEPNTEKRGAPVRPSVIPAVPMPTQKRAPAPIPAPAPPPTIAQRPGRNAKPRSDLADHYPPLLPEMAGEHLSQPTQSTLNKNDAVEPRGPTVDGIAFKMGGLSTSENTRSSNAPRTHATRSTKTVPQEDYNFDEANLKFNKEGISKPEEDGDDQQDLIPPAEVAYNPGQSFFDNISNGNREAEHGGAEWRDAERSLNYETFGESRVPRGRGRGGRGRGRGRGRFGRGSRGRGPSAMLEQNV